MPPGGPYGPPPGGWPHQRKGGGLATASLVLGIVSLFLLLACGIGVLTAIVGLVLGIIAAMRGVARGRAIAGIILSALALLLAAAFAVWFANTGVGDCFDSSRYTTQGEVQQCLEGRLGVQVSTGP